MKTGHFYFGKNQTFLNWLDSVVPPYLPRFFSCGNILSRTIKVDGTGEDNA